MIVSLSADGSRAVAASSSYGVSMWNLSGEPRRVNVEDWNDDRAMISVKLVRVVYTVRSVSMRADGSELLFGGFGSYASDGGDYPTLVLLGFRNRRRTFKVGVGSHGRHITSVSLSADGSLALAGGTEGFLGLWKVSTKHRLPLFARYLDEVTAVHLSADGCWAAVAGSIQTRRFLPLRWLGRDHKRERIETSSGEDRLPVIRLWNMKTGRRVELLEEHFVQAISLNADGRWLLSSGDTALHLWEVETGRCIQVLRGHTKGIPVVSLSADGSLALSGSADATVRVWDLRRGRCLRTLKGHKGAVTSVSLSADGQVGISCDPNASGGGTVRLWRIEPTNFLCALYPSPITTSEESMHLETHASQLLSQVRQAREEGHFSAAVALMGELRALAGYERAPGVLEEWGILTRSARRVRLRGAWPLKTLRGHRYNVDSVALSADGRLAISGSRIDGAAYIWDVETERCLYSIGFANGGGSVSLSADGSRTLSVGTDRVGVWDAQSGSRLSLFEHENSVACLSMDGRWFVSTNPADVVRNWKEATAHVWDVNTGNCVAILYSQKHGADAVNLSLDGRFAITGSDDLTARVWDVTQGRCTAVLQGPDLSVISDVALSADGRFAITGDDKAVRVWDVVHEQCMSVFPIRGGGYPRKNPVSLSADGSFAITGGADYTVQIWDVRQERCVSMLHGHTAEITSVMLSADGQRVISASRDGTARVWTLDWELEASDSADWDDGARSYLEAFLILHTPYATGLPVPQKRLPLEDGAVRAVTRWGVPTWTEKDFQGLIHLLQCAGYGWLQAEGVRKQLEQGR